jgi:HlyD family secretion protein
MNWNRTDWFDVMASRLRLLWVTLMKLFFLVLVVAGAGAAAYYKPWQGDAAAATEQSAWMAIEPRNRDLSSSVLATGIVRPSVGAEVAVGSRASGILKKLHCDVGTSVKAGALLAELDPAEFAAARRQAAAAVELANAERDYASVALQRKKKLGKIAPADDLDVAHRAFRVAEAQVEQAEARLESANIQLAFTKIVAPISGVVASVSTQVGETVAASFSAPTFVTIIDLARLEVWAYVDETDIGRIAVGQDVVFNVDTYAGTDFAGRVSAIYPKPEVRDNVVNYIAIVEIEPGAAQAEAKVLRPEMTATLRIQLEGRTDALCVPNRAVQVDAAGPHVLVHDAAGSPVRRSIEAGFRGREFTEVVTGLSAGERVLVANDAMKERK